MSQWLANEPTDPLKQIAAVWHAYPAYGTTWGTTAYTLPGGGEASYSNAQSIISAGIPVIITESGDQDTAGTVGAPFESKLLPWADKAGASYLGWPGMCGRTPAMSSSRTPPAHPPMAMAPTSNNTSTAWRAGASLAPSDSLPAQWSA